jgi:hypothetical protein
MFCESHRKALNEAVLVGGRPPAACEAHLALCAGCREAFADEQALLRRIDAGVSSVMVSEMPASLIPGVRARVAGLAESRSGSRLVLAYATAAFAVGVFAVCLGMRGRAPRAQLEMPSVGSRSAGKSPTAPPVAGEPRAKAQAPGDRVISMPRAAASRPGLRHGQPQVLISGEDQLGLERYVASFRVAASGGKATLKEETAAEIKPLEIAELDVKRLSIEPLDGGNSD